MSDSYQLTITFPQSVKTLLPDGELEARRLIATQLYLNETVSIGRAAEVAGMNRVDFETYLSERQIPISLLTYEEVMADVEKIRNLRAKNCS
jgi:predicted HTH domain antitoxin